MQNRLDKYGLFSLNNLLLLMAFLLEDLHWLCGYMGWIINNMAKVAVLGRIVCSPSFPNKAQLMEAKCFHGSTGNYEKCHLVIVAFGVMMEPLFL